MNADLHTATAKAMYEYNDEGALWENASATARVRASQQVRGILHYLERNGLAIMRDPSKKSMISEVAKKLEHPHNDAAMTDATDAVEAVRKMWVYA
jgi:hypothetical protein